MRQLLYIVALLLSSAFSLAGETRYLGHVTNSTAGFKTRLLLSNFATTPKKIDLFAYKNLGELITTRTLTVDGKGYLNLDVAELFESSLVSYITLSGSRMITATLRMSADSANGGADALIQETSDLGRFFRIYPSRISRDTSSWEGLAITDFNFGQEYLANIRIALIAAENGETLAEQEVQITGGEKKLVNLTKLFPQSSGLPDQGFYYEINSGPEVVVTAMSGNTSRLEANSVLSLYPREVEKPTVKTEPLAEGGQLNAVSFDSRFLTLAITLTNPCQQVTFQWDGKTDGETARFQLGYHTRAEVCTDELVEVEKDLDLLDIFNAWDQVLRTLLIQDMNGNELARVSLRD